MNDNYDILKDIDFWLQLSERFFEADTTKEEERALMRFVVSEFAEDDSLDEHAKSVFREVKATMSFMQIAKGYNEQKEELTDVTPDFSLNNTNKSKTRTIWTWIAATAAVIMLFFLVKSTPLVEMDGIIDERNVCVASDNGAIITDKSKVLSMMQDSWNEIDIHESSGTEVGAQLKELFDVLE